MVDGKSHESDSHVKRMGDRWRELKVSKLRSTHEQAWYPGYPEETGIHIRESRTEIEKCIYMLNSVPNMEGEAGKSACCGTCVSGLFDSPIAVLRKQHEF